MSAAAPAGSTPSTPQSQRAVLVLPSSGEFDSRTYRIATSLAGRGHEVTVLARWAPGLPFAETDAAGYRTVRVAVDAIDGLPMARLWRAVLRRPRRVQAVGTGVLVAGATPRGQGPPAGSMNEVAGGLLARVRRTIRGAVRVAAIVLTVRAQTIASRTVDPGADIYHGMAYMGIPVALSLARGRRARVVYDARDIYLEARNLARLPRPMRYLVGRLERRWANRADRVATVNSAYAEVLAERFGVPRPLVVMNCSSRYEPPEPRERRFHEVLGLSADERVVLYHGGLFPHRGIEELIAAIVEVPDATLVCMGYGALEADLRKRAADPSLEGRLRILAAVRPDELLDWVACADVVAMPIQPSTLNHRLTTPNKLFEAMAAGVPVVASDLPGMAAIVRDTGCGILVEPTDPAAIATAVRTILDAPADERAGFGRRALDAAHTTYSWDRQAEILLAEYGRLTGKAW